MEVSVTIDCTEESIRIKNNLGVEWNFCDQMTAENALVLLLSQTMQGQLKLQNSTRNKFKIKLTVTPSK